MEKKKLQKSDSKFKVEIVLIDKLKPHKRNYKVHNEEQLAHIIQSLKDNGYYRNIIVAKDYTILAGHGVIEGAKKLGLTEAPVYRMPFSSKDPRSMKILIGDNEVSHLAEIDDRLLTDMLQELNISNELLGTGYDPLMLAGRLFVTRSETEVATLDKAKEWLGMPEYDESSGPEIKLVINFRKESDRQELVDKIGLIVSNRDRLTKTAWYPHKERNDINSVKFENE
jgi:hypothetical protein